MFAALAAASVRLISPRIVEMANIVGVTFVFKEDFYLVKLPRSASFQELRHAWSAELHLSDATHLFRPHKFDGGLLPEHGTVSQLLTSPHDLAFIVYVELREITLAEMEKQQAEHPPELLPTADKNYQTFPVEVYPTRLFCPSASLVELAESCCSDVAPIFRPTNQDDALLLSCFAGAPHRLVRQMIDKFGANPHTFGMSGATPLHYAARGGHEKVCRVLIWAGVEVDARDRKMNTPLILAARQGHFKVVRLLIDGDADIEARDTDGMTPLMHAAWRGNANVVEWLLKYGAEYDAVSNNLWTPLMRSCITGHPTCARMLLDKNCVVDWLNDREFTALCLAARGGSLACVKLLVETGVSLRNQRVRDAMQQAGDKGYYLVNRYLRPLFNEMSLEDQIMAGMEEDPDELHFYLGRDPFRGKRRYKKSKRIRDPPPPVLVTDTPIEATTSTTTTTTESGTRTSATEAPGAEAPGAEAPGIEASSAEAPGAEAPGIEASSAEAPGAEAPGAEAPGESPGAEGPSSPEDRGDEPR